MGKYFLVALFCTFLCSSRAQFLNATFPDGFIWSTATSAYQIEGAWNSDGKGEHIWDRFCHDGRCSGQNGDFACNSYYMIAEDVAVLQEIGVQMYRFSLSWARILPTGQLAGGVNQAGINYYNQLIDSLLAAGITPMVTLYHWDLPQPLQDQGGWHNVAMVDYFTDFADVAFLNFGDRVKYWLTFNEPFVICWLGYGNGIFAPGVWDPGEGGYKAMHNLLLAHAEAWHLYDEQYRPLHGGMCSITLDGDWNEPNSTSQADIDAAERANVFKLGWYANPIFGSGDYPLVMREMVANKSANQGFSQSRMPVFTQEQIDRIKGSHDAFFGLNHYTTYLAFHNTHGLDCVSYECDHDVSTTRDPSWPESGSGWLRVVPWGLRKLLNWIRTQYGDVPIFITENGVSDRNATLQDTHRVNFYRDYINEVLKANVTDGVNVIGYTAWSMMDNFEWGQGFQEKFGLFHVDFNDPARTRTPKDSATAYRQIILDNGFPPLN